MRERFCFAIASGMRRVIKTDINFGDGWAVCGWWLRLPAALNWRWFCCERTQFRLMCARNVVLNNLIPNNPNVKFLINFRRNNRDGWLVEFLIKGQQKLACRRNHLTL